MELLPAILKPEQKTRIVDVGSAAIDGPPPYAFMRGSGLCTVVGFDPQTDLHPKQDSAFESYFPHVIGDGSAGHLLIRKAPGMTGLFAVDEDVFDLFPGMRRWCELVRSEPVVTRRLDDIRAVDRIDLLKVDAQGSELGVIQSAAAKLKDAVFVQLEVQFVRLYRDAPMFADLMTSMERRGFMLHTFSQADHRMILPYTYPADPDHAAMHQLFSADAVFVRDLTKMDGLETEAVKHMGLIAHYCYSSFDLTYRCIDHLERRHVLPAGEADRYMQSLAAAEEKPAERAENGQWW